MIELGPAPATTPRSAYLEARPPRYQLRTETALPGPLPEVFAFFSDATNLARITPPDLGFTIVNAPAAMAVGAVIDYRVRVLGVRVKWRTVIDAWEPPTAGATSARFVDSQARGPYACWWHEHRFEADGAGTRMTDTVLYAPPFGPLGAIPNRLVVARQLRRIFAFRAEAIRAYM